VASSCFGPCATAAPRLRRLAEEGVNLAGPVSYWATELFYEIDERDLAATRAGR
jgi:hypothetical protein